MDSQTTLREAIKEFYTVNFKYFSSRDISPKAEELFRCHDTAHVVFGCDTSILGEGMVKIWTIFGTSLGFWKHLEGYAEADAFSLFKEYRWSHVANNIFKIFITAPRVIIRARLMNKRWPWSSFEPYLDLPLDAIRKEFNIKPIVNA